MYLFILPLAALLALCLLALLRWSDYLLPPRFLKQTAQAEAPSPVVPAKNCPSISVVIPTHNEDHALADTLRAVLSQEDVVFEVIVVDIASTDDTSSVLDAFCAEHANIRRTYVPATSRAINRRQLALTLGIRASYAPWVVLTRPGCLPDSPLWLAGLNRYFTDGTDIVAGYTGYNDDGDPRLCRASWHRLRSFMKTLRGQRRGLLATTDTNLALRRDAFFNAGGFTTMRRVPFGEGELLSNLLSQNGGTAVTADFTTRVRMPLPPTYAMRSRLAESYETLRHLPTYWHWLRWREGAATCCIVLFSFIMAVQILWLGFAAFLHTGATITLPPMAALHRLTFWASQTEPSQLWISGGSTLLLLVAALTTPILLARRAADAMNEPRPGARLWGYALASPFGRLRARLSRLRHRREYHLPIVPPTD